MPHEVWWDNPTDGGRPDLQGPRADGPTSEYAALASHYNFEPLFCMPARGNEKPHAENRVQGAAAAVGHAGAARSPTWTPERSPAACCLRAKRQRTVGGHAETIGQRFERDRAARPAVARAHASTPASRRAAKVDKYQTVRFDNNRYSVPRAWRFQAVTVKGYVDRVEVVARRPGGGAARAQLRPRTSRSSIRCTTWPRWGGKPACLDHAPVFRDWRLPPRRSTELRQHLEQRHGPLAGARQFIRVLQLLAEHPIERVRRGRSS